MSKGKQIYLSANELELLEDMLLNDCYFSESEDNEETKKKEILITKITGKIKI